MDQHVEQGLAIRAARLSKNMTQAHLASLSGVSEKTVRRAELGERIAPESVRGMCSALGLDAENLRSEVEMSPAAARESDARVAGRARGGRVEAAILAASCAATMATLESGVPAGRVVLAFALAGAASVAVLALLSVAVVLFPGLRVRISGAVSAFGRVAGDGEAARHALALAALPPAMAVVVRSLGSFVAAPGAGTAGAIAIAAAVTAHVCTVAFSRDDAREGRVPTRPAGT